MAVCVTGIPEHHTCGRVYTGATPHPEQTIAGCSFGIECTGIGHHCTLERASFLMTLRTVLLYSG